MTRGVAKEKACLACWQRRAAGRVSNKGVGKASSTVVLLSNTRRVACLHNLPGASEGRV